MRSSAVLVLEVWSPSGKCREIGTFGGAGHLQIEYSVCFMSSLSYLKHRHGIPLWTRVVGHAPKAVDQMTCPKRTKATNLKSGRLQWRCLIELVASRACFQTVNGHLVHPVHRSVGPGHTWRTPKPQWHHHETHAELNRATDRFLPSLTLFGNMTIVTLIARRIRRRCWRCRLLLGLARRSDQRPMFIWAGCK